MSGSDGEFPLDPYLFPAVERLLVSFGRAFQNHNWLNMITLYHRYSLKTK